MRPSSSRGIVVAIIGWSVRTLWLVKSPAQTRRLQHQPPQSPRPLPAQDPANLRSAQRRHRRRRWRREGVGPAPLQLLPFNPVPAPLPPARPAHRRRVGAGSSDRAARGPRSSEPVPVGAGDDAPCVAHLAASTRPVDKGRGGGRRRLAARVAAGRRAARARITRPAGIAQLARRARRGGSLRTPASRPPSQAILACARWARSCAKASRCAL